MSTVLLRLRPGQENERGPLYMESSLAALHSLGGSDSEVGFEIGMVKEGKVSFFIRTTNTANSLVESQVYAQYPDSDIERVADPFVVGENESVVSMDLVLSKPDVFPIKRHPQFDDLLAGANMDPIASITSVLARYPTPGMRGHVQLVVKPVSSSYRKRVVGFLPLMGKGLSKMIPAYGVLFANVHLARGWMRPLLLPFDILMGGFRTWPGIRRYFVAAEAAGKPAESGDKSAPSGRSHERETPTAGAQDKMNRLLFFCNIRISVITPKGHEEEAKRKIMEIAGTFRQFTLLQSNGFAATPVQTAPTMPTGIIRKPFMLSNEEIATLWHVPTILVQTSNLDRVLAKKLEPPVNLPLPGTTGNDDLTILGEANFQAQRTKFGIKPEDRMRHIYAIGKTGMGKSVLLQNMVYSDIMAGKGVAVIDPHGDLIDSILTFIPKNRMNDVVLFDPADRDYPISFNMLESKNPDQRSLVASGLMSVFMKLWPDAFSGRMEHILRNCLLALLEYEGSTMLGILRLFGDDEYRKKVVEKITDPVVKSFWEIEYAGWSDKYRTEAIAAIQNKIGQLLTTPLIRNIVGQVSSTLDIRHAMDTGKIVLVNLSKGKLGEDTSAFLGSMLATKFQIDAMSRADIAEKDRREFYLYVDEFQNFATKSFATILSEARKYRLSLTVAHQYISQLMLPGGDSSLRDAVFGNVGSIVSFQVGSDDAETLSLQFEEMAVPKDILSLPKYHAYVRLMIDGIPSKPFSVATLPPPKPEIDEKRVEKIRELSRERYAEKRSIVEEKILRWANIANEAKVKSVAAEKAKEKENEERKKARAKGMTLVAYRAWRDREMWMNSYNALKKREMLGETLNPTETAEFKDLEAKLMKTGGVPPPSKSMLQAVEDAKNPKTE